MGRSNVVKFRPHQIADDIATRPDKGSLPKRTLPERVVCSALSVLPIVFMCCLLIGSSKVEPPAQRPMMGAFSTTKGQHACWKLPEKSEVCLNTGALVDWAFTGSTRHLEVVAGEVTFTVQKDSRPFEVRSDGALIRDVSTRFGVYRKDGSTTVTVIEGGVKVMAPADAQAQRAFDLLRPESGWDSAPEYHRLQQVVFDESTRTLRERPPLTEKELAQLLAWRHGRIDVTGRSLSDAFRELARYQPIERVDFTDAELSLLKLPDGESDPSDLKGFLEMVAARGVHYTLTRKIDGQIVVTLSRAPHKGGRSHSK